MLYDKQVIKIILPIILIIILGIFLYYKFVFLASNQKANPASLITNPITGSKEVPAEVDDHSKIQVLEKTVNLISDKLNKTGSSSGLVPDSSLDGRLTTLENNLNVLAGRVAKLEQGTTTTQTTSTKSPSVYIPLGAGKASVTDWTSTSLPQVQIDTANYPGYKNMYLEVSLLIFQGNGTAYARLLNVTDGTAVLSSQVSTTNSDYSLLTSSGFQITAGKKTYGLELKSSTGYSADAQFARIRVDF